MQYWLWRGLRVLWRRDDWLLVRYHLAGGCGVEPALPEGYRLLRGSELERGYQDWPDRNRRIRARLEDPRQRGMGVEVDGHLVYDTWIWLGAYDEPGSGIRLDPGPRGGVLLDSWTEPRSRGRGLHAALLAWRLTEAHNLGLDTLDGLVHWRNIPAMRAQRGAGADAVKRYVCLRLLGLSWRLERETGWEHVDLRRAPLSPDK